MTIPRVPDGLEGLVVADLARTISAAKDAPWPSLAVICRDGQRLAALERGLAFFAPDLEVHAFPSWDCLPYDRASPNGAITASA